ncbi:MAG: trimeric intracellular cation channel family protein, partial [Desulfobacteraceae bacterium]
MDVYAHRFIYPLITLDYYQGLIYVVVFAITGVLAVGRKDVDLFGVVMLGLITALGGGTIRDILLDIRVFWVQDFNYVWVGALAALAAFFGVRNFGLHALYRPLLYLDAVGVALFSVQTIDRVLAMKKG